MCSSEINVLLKKGSLRSPYSDRNNCLQFVLCSTEASLVICTHFVFTTVKQEVQTHFDKYTT